MTAQYNDLEGKRFGSWLVKHRCTAPERRNKSYVCRCDCGTEKAVTAQSLILGESKSCGCVSIKLRKERIQKLVGKTFNRLVLLFHCGAIRSGANVWLCKCLDCGTEKCLREHDVTDGKTKSCGCHNTRTTTNRNLKHGHAFRKKQTRSYISWCSMVSRCTIPSATGYENYGGRGITICKEWESFETFYQDMGERPKGFTLERLDVNGNYEPLNCIWLPKDEQSYNQRHTKLTREKVLEIRDRWKAGENRHALAESYGISVGHLHAVVSGRTWKAAIKKDVELDTKSRPNHILIARK